MNKLANTSNAFSKFVLLHLQDLKIAKGRILQDNKSKITVIHQNEIDYIGLTDMTATFKEGSGLIGFHFAMWLSPEFQI